VKSTMKRLVPLWLALVVMVAVSPASLRGEDLSKFPDWTGQWTQSGGAQWDPTKPGNRGQQPPLTAEYDAEWTAAQADLRAGGRGNTPSMTCTRLGLPRALLVYESMEFVIKPDITYVMLEHLDPLRRIYTDGRDWPKAIPPAYVGYSIGRWEDSEGAGRFDTLLVETRGFKGPRIVDGSGIPLGRDNATIIRERFYLDKADRNFLHDEVTLIDSALTRPWTVNRSYRRHVNPRWHEYDCQADNQHVFIGNDPFLLSADGYLMPTRKDQAPPDLRYFGQAK
jgi:hypothetical protein